MANFTEIALKKTFVELLEEKPLDKITITDITNKCGVNRNTFYYHYHDIYDILGQILNDEKAKILDMASDDFSTWQKAVLEGTKFALENKRLIYNVYNSVNRDIIENFLFDSVFISMKNFVETEAAEISPKPSEDSIDNISNLLSSSIVGIMLNWLRNGMSDDPKKFLEDMGLLLKGSTKRALQTAGSQSAAGNQSE